VIAPPHIIVSQFQSGLSMAKTRLAISTINRMVGLCPGYWDVLCRNL